MQKKKKVLVALSGGVDSSVSAALLLQAGYEVEGAFIRTWTAPWMPCTWKEERRDAMRVAAHLHIPFHTVDLSQEYEEEVVRYLIDEYKKGRTPNPDVMCNKYIKFGGFFSYALERGFDMVATGHYARVGVDTNTRTHTLTTAVDENKDQTYFLWTLTEEHLARTLFPVGTYTKPEVRALARSFRLPTAEKKDSQGICFLGKVHMKDFLSHYIEPAPGDVLSVDGTVIGKHDGAVFLTLGQRHGFTVFQHTPNTEPLYVVHKDMNKNTVTVSTSNVPSDACTSTYSLFDVTLRGVKCTGVCEARLRYRQKLFPVTIQTFDPGQRTALIRSEEPQPYVQQGQSLVLYKGSVCLGGGVIG